MTWRLSDGGTEKLARWIRCLFSLALSETDIAMQLLDQALIIAEDARKVCDSSSLKHNSDDLTQILSCSSPSRIHPKKSNGSQRRPSIARLTSTVPRKMRCAGFGLKRPWRCRIFARTGEICMRYFNRSIKECCGIHDCSEKIWNAAELE